MTLVERLNRFGGRVGEYEWRVEVWRSDTLALANLRTKTKVFRVNESPWPVPDQRVEVFSDSGVATRKNLEERAEEEVSRAESAARRFDSERETAEAL